MRSANERLRAGIEQMHRKAGMVCAYTPQQGETTTVHLYGLALEDVGGDGYSVGIPERGTYAYVLFSQVPSPRRGDTFQIEIDTDPVYAGLWEVSGRDTDYIDAFRCRVNVTRTACMAADAEVAA